jgi:3-methyl-2-oxobutanoate hydroxymethyltransferase
VKLEGGSGFRLETIERIIDCGIPVMGHLGLTPQSVHKLGGYGTQAKTAYAGADLIRQAIELEKAGVFSIVLENIPDEVAAEATDALRVPTIGIGAGTQCDGQVLVINDILGFSGDYRPPFVKQYADLAGIIGDAVERFCSEVRSTDFPGEEHTVKMKEKNKEEFRALMSKDRGRG